MTFPKVLISAGLSAGLAGLSAMTVSTPAYADRFDTCVKSFWPAAKRAGVSWDTFQRATAGITFDNEVIEAAKFQPEYKKPMGEYVDRAISPKRLAMGQQKLVEYGPLLDQVEARYGVDKHIVLAIWGVESNYGTNKGDMHVIQSLMTLACSGTKAKFARGQIVSALKILQHGDTDPAHFSGSWAGAMGHTQFIPTTYSAYAVDFDGDGRRDIWDTVPDALGSTAAYLRKSNWIPGQTWGYEVKLPASYTAKSYKRGSLRTLAQWQAAGITRVNGKPFPRPGDKAQLLSPDGRNGPSFLVLNNFRSILRYNQADSYALAVGHLADRLAGYGAFVQAWPTSELRLSMEQRTEMQQYLIALGYLQGDADGIIGSGTMDGVRAYQRAKGLPVDGYPTQTILKKLRADAPAIMPAAAPAAPAAMAPQSTASIPAPQALPPQAPPVQAVAPQAVQQQALPPQAAAPQALVPQGAMPQAFAPQVYPQQPHPLQTLPWDSWHTGGVSSHPRSAADAAPPPGN